MLLAVKEERYRAKGVGPLKSTAAADLIIATIFNSKIGERGREKESRSTVYDKGINEWPLISSM